MIALSRSSWVVAPKVLVPWKVVVGDKVHVQKLLFPRVDRKSQLHFLEKKKVCKPPFAAMFKQPLTRTIAADLARCLSNLARACC